MPEKFEWDEHHWDAEKNYVTHIVLHNYTDSCRNFHSPPDISTDWIIVREEFGLSLMSTDTILS